MSEPSSVLEIRADFFDVELVEPIHLVIGDLPYGDIVPEDWDRMTEEQATGLYVKTMRRLQDWCVPGAAAYIFWGVGRPGMRPFWRALPIIEGTTKWKMATPITWKKKRAYGIQWSYLFTREEIAYFVMGDPKKPRVFHPPYLEEKRGYPGYDKKYPAKSEYKRRTNVWTDVTEILRGKTHRCQKPTELYRIMVEASSNPGDTVLDPFAGSGTLAKAAPDRRVIMIEKEPKNVSISPT